MKGKSSLALIDRAAQATVAYELGESTDRAELTRLGIRPRRTRHIAGLTVISNAARDASVSPEAAKAAARLKQYRADREQVKSQMNDAGIPPLAILPLSAWDRICERAKLFRFTPQNDSVRFDATAIVAEAEIATKEESKKDKLPDSAGFSMFFVILCFAVAGVVGGVNVFDYFHLPYGGIGGVVGFFFAGFVGLYAVSFFYENLPSVKKKMREREARNIRSVTNTAMRNGSLFNKLWPDYREPADGKTVRIALPPVPQRVQERILAAEKAGLTMHVAAVGEAIALREDVSESIVGLRAAEWDVRGHELMLKYDPIIYVVHGSAVAVLDQFGEFPIEKEVVNEVVNSEHFI